MNRVIVCRHEQNAFGEHWEVWIDGKDVEEPCFKDFTIKSDAEQYAQDLAAKHNIEIVFP